MHVSQRLLWSVLSALVFLNVNAMARPLTIVCLGDSTTAGTPYGHSPLERPPSGEGPEESFYGYWVHKSEPDWTLVNKGIGGNNTDQMLARMADALEPHPHYVVVLAGVNDIYQGLGVANAQKNLQKIYGLIVKAKAVPVVASVLPFDRATPEQTRQINALNGWIKQTALSMRLPFVDLNAVVTDPKRPGYFIGSPDGLHPDMACYRKMGEAMLTRLRALENTR